MIIANRLGIDHSGLFKVVLESIGSKLIASPELIGHRVVALNGGESVKSASREIARRQSRPAT
jgi:uncharacterized protein YegP (UPF0339 family)